MESVEISGIMGTSAGALTGSLLAAGYTPDEVEYELARVAPMEYLSPNPQLWQGVLKVRPCRVCSRLARAGAQGHATRGQPHHERCGASRAARQGAPL